MRRRDSFDKRVKEAGKRLFKRVRVSSLGNKRIFRNVLSLIFILNISKLVGEMIRVLNDVRINLMVAACAFEDEVEEICKRV